MALTCLKSFNVCTLLWGKEAKSWTLPQAPAWFGPSLLSSLIATTVPFDYWALSPRPASSSLYSTIKYVPSEIFFSLPSFMPHSCMPPTHSSSLSITVSSSGLAYILTLSHSTLCFTFIALSKTQGDYLCKCLSNTSCTNYVVNSMQTVSINVWLAVVPQHLTCYMGHKKWMREWMSGISYFIPLYSLKTKLKKFYDECKCQIRNLIHILKTVPGSINIYCLINIEQYYYKSILHYKVIKHLL